MPRWRDEEMQRWRDEEMKKGHYYTRTGDVFSKGRKVVRARIRPANSDFIKSPPRDTGKRFFGRGFCLAGTADGGRRRADGGITVAFETMT